MVDPYYDDGDIGMIMVLASRVSGCLFGHPKKFCEEFLKMFIPSIYLIFVIALLFQRQCIWISCLILIDLYIFIHP